MTREQYDREIVNYRGPDLINFYYRMQDKFKQRALRPTPVPSIRRYLYILTLINYFT